MRTIKNIAEEVLAKEFASCYPYHNNSTYIDAMIEFARQMCELQKEHCAKNATLYEAEINKDDIREAENQNEDEDYDFCDDYDSIVWRDEYEAVGINVDRESILNTPNVCEI